jgi:hypothetical protein
MPATMQTLTPVLKERYEGKLRKQLNQDVVALRRITKTSSGVTSETGGKYVTFPIHTRRNSGIGARNEGEALPLPGQQGTAGVRIPLKYLYGLMELTGQAFELANENPKSFISSVELETDGLRDDLAKDLNRQVYGNGTGSLATVSAIATNVLTVSSTQYFNLDMMVDVVNGTTVKASNRKVTAIDDVARTVTIDGAAVTYAANDFVVRTGNLNREWVGLGGIINNSGTLYNLDSAIEPVWKSVVDANGGTPRAISESRLIARYNDIRRNGGKTTVMITSPGVMLSYFNLLSQQRQYVNTKDFTGGFNGLAFVTEGGEIPIVQDFDAPAGTIYGLNENDLKLYRTHDWKFMDRDGSMWQRKVTSGGSFDAYYATLFQYSELGISRRNSHYVIRDITETV